MVSVRGQVKQVPTVEDSVPIEDGTEREDERRIGVHPLKWLEIIENI